MADAMSSTLHFLILTVAGWLQRRMEAKIEYLSAENTLYKQRLGRAGLRLTEKCRYSQAMSLRFHPSRVARAWMTRRFGVIGAAAALGCAARRCPRSCRVAYSASGVGLPKSLF